MNQILKLAYLLSATCVVFAFPSPNNATDADLTEWMAAHRNPYGFLEIPHDATKTEIRRVFMRNMLQWHPDKYRQGSPASEEARTEFFKRITSASREVESFNGHVSSFFPRSMQGFDSVDFDRLVAGGRFAKLFDLVVPMPFDTTLMWEDYMQRFVFNQTADVLTGMCMFAGAAMGALRMPREDFDKEVALSVAHFTPKLREMLDAIMEPVKPSGAEAWTAVVGGSGGLDSDIAAAAVPMYGGRMNTLIGKTLKRMAWTRNPGLFRFVTTRSYRLNYVNGFKPSFKILVRMNKWFSMAVKFSNASGKKEYQKAVHMFDRYIWNYIALLVEPVIRNSAYSILYKWGVTRGESKKLAKAMKTLGKKFLSAKQAVSDEEAFMEQYKGRDFSKSFSVKRTI